MPMNSCDVFLYSVARAYVHFGICLFICFSWGPTNEGVHKGPPKPSYATDYTGVADIRLLIRKTVFLSSLWQTVHQNDTVNIGVVLNANSQDLRDG